MIWSYWVFLRHLLVFRNNFLCFHSYFIDFSDFKLCNQINTNGNVKWNVTDQETILRGFSCLMSLWYNIRYSIPDGIAKAVPLSMLEARVAQQMYLAYHQKRNSTTTEEPEAVQALYWKLTDMAKEWVVPSILRVWYLNDNKIKSEMASCCLFLFFFLNLRSQEILNIKSVCLEILCKTE